MPTTTRRLKLAITDSEEIGSLMSFLNELDAFYKHDLVSFNLSDVDISEYETLKRFDKSNPELFLENILERLSNIHHQRILWNCETLLKNCADLTKDTLDYHPDIKKGLELLEEKEEADRKALLEIHKTTIYSLEECERVYDVCKSIPAVQSILILCERTNTSLGDAINSLKDIT